MILFSETRWCFLDAALLGEIKISDNCVIEYWSSMVGLKRQITTNVG